MEKIGIIHVFSWKDNCSKRTQIAAELVNNSRGYCKIARIYYFLAIKFPQNIFNISYATKEGLYVLKYNKNKQWKGARYYLVKFY